MPDNNSPADTDSLVITQYYWTSWDSRRASQLFEEIDRDISEVVYLATISGDLRFAQDLASLLVTTMGLQKSFWDTMVMKLDEMSFD